MAASHSYLPCAHRPALPGLGVQAAPMRVNHSEYIHLVLGLRRVLLMLACPSHRWNWPRPIPSAERPDGYDAHQTCFKCMTERFYNTRTLQAGPLFRRLTLGSEEYVPVPVAVRAGLRKNWEKQIQRLREFRLEMKAILTARRQQA